MEVRGARRILMLSHVLLPLATRCCYMNFLVAGIDFGRRMCGLVTRIDLRFRDTRSALGVVLMTFVVAFVLRESYE